MPLNDGFRGWINQGFPPERIERVEVIPGGGELVWNMGYVRHRL